MYTSDPFCANALTKQHLPSQTSPTHIHTFLQHIKEKKKKIERQGKQHSTSDSKPMIRNPDY